MSLYNSQDWKALHPITRAELLLVIEGEKPGAIVYGDWNAFQRVIKETGLAYMPTSRKYDLRLTAFVATPQRIAAFGKRALEPQPPHRFFLWGESLGYPECCIAEYSRPRTQAEHEAKRRKDHLHSYKFGRELDDIIKRTGTYPAIFDYCPPAFTPCAVNCENAIKTLNRWKFALDWLDPEAANELVRFNRTDEPERRAHKEYLAAYDNDHRAEERARWEAEKRRWLRGEYNHFFPQLLRHRKRRPQPL